MSTQKDITVGQTSSWVATVKDNAAAVNLSSATTVEMKVVDEPGSATPLIDWTAVTPDPDQTTNTGQVSYTPSSGDVDTAGRYFVQFRVTWGDGSVDFFPDQGNFAVLVIHDAA